MFVGVRFGDVLFVLFEVLALYDPRVVLGEKRGPSWVS